MTFKVDVKNRFKLAPEYIHAKPEDLMSLMTNEEVVFCDAYMSSGGNGGLAGKAVRAIKPNLKVYKDKVKEQRVNSATASYMLKKPLVYSFLYLQIEKLRQKAVKSVERGYEAYLDKFEEIRELALADGDLGTALRAHKELGQELGHSRSESQSVSHASDAELIKQIAGTNQALVETLSKQLGVKTLIHKG